MYRKKILAGLGWNGFVAALSNLFNILRVFLVARLLGPEEVGLYAMAITMMTGITVFGQVGFKSAFIVHHYRSEEEKARWLITMWTANVSINIILSILLALLAWPISHIIGDERLFSLILALTVAPVLTALVNPQVIHQERMMQYRTMAWVELSRVIAITSIMIVFAYLYRSVWAMVIGHVGGTILSLLLSYWLKREFLPYPQLDKEALRAFIHYGKNIILISLLLYLITQLDNAIIGSQLGMKMLGIYLLVYQITMTPVGIIASVFGHTMQPFLSNILENTPTKFMMLWLKNFRWAFWTLSGMLLCAVLVFETLIHLFFGKEWVDAIPLIVPLAVAALARGLVQSIILVMMGLKRPDACVRNDTVLAITILPGIILAAKYGSIEVVVMVVACCFMLSLLLNLTWILKNTALTLSRFMDVMLGPVAVATVAYVQVKHLPLLEWSLVSVGGIVLCTLLIGAVWVDDSVRHEVKKLSLLVSKSVGW